MRRRRLSRRTFLSSAMGAAAGATLAPGLIRVAGAAPLRRMGGISPDLILMNANLVTMNPALPSAQAVAVGGGRILAVGSNDEASGWAASGTQVRNLSGQTLIPGFYDSHNHMLRTGLNLNAVDLSETESIAEVLQAIAERAAVTPPGEWIVSSSRWHESQLAEQRFPRREELDGVAPDNPVLIRRGGHNVVVNSLAFQLAGITEETPNPPGGTYVKDPETGQLTGHIIGGVAFGRILRLLPPVTKEDQLAALRAVLRLYREAGITSLIEPGLAASDMELYRELAASGELTTRTSLMWRLGPGTTDNTLQAALGALRSGEVVRSLDDPWVRTLAIKLGADGGVETGFHRDPYAYTDDPANPRGKPQMTPETMAAFCTEAARFGWQVGTHCVGDAAIDMVLEAYDAVNQVVPIADKRWHLIHMMAAKPDHFSLVNKLGLGITAQQPLMYSLAAGFIRYIGPERAKDIEPLRLYLDGSQQPVGGGSDSPVTPYEPLLGLWSSVTRMTDLVGVQGPEWAISAEEALRMYTMGSAWCAFEEQVKGSIQPGKYADLVALSDDPRAVEPEAIKDIQVMLTVVDGQVVFDRERGTTVGTVPPVRTTSASLAEGCDCTASEDEHSLHARAVPSRRLRG